MLAALDRTDDVLDGAAGYFAEAAAAQPWAAPDGWALRVAAVLVGAVRRLGLFQFVVLGARLKPYE